MIELRGVSKRYGDTIAVDDLSMEIPAGLVTGFLGPNGAGKSTTMRMIVGLDRPTKGTVWVNGRDYQQMRYPLREVGALLEAKAIHPGRSARNHLRWLADSNSIPRRRVDDVLEQVGLASVARKRSGTFSLGMGQRLGIAAALLGDPGVLLLDEPVNGLDPEGILWVRNLLRSLAREGRTVFVSSHLMSEMALTADQLIVVGRGRLIASGSVAEITQHGSGNTVRVSSPDLDRLGALLVSQGATVAREGPEVASISGLTCREVGAMAFDAGVMVWELTQQQASLEEAFMEMTRDTGEFHAEPTPGQAGVT